MSSATARATTPIPQNGTVPPRPVPQAQRRPREYLTPKEVERLITAARQNRHGHRDAAMIRVAYRHGLRVSELCALRWDQVDFEHGLLHVRRIKNGTPSVHPLGGGELRALHKLQREAIPSPYVFTTERRAPMSPAGFRKMLARTGEAGAFPFPVHPHMIAACLRLQARQRRPGYAGLAALSRPQEHPAHGALHRTRGRSLQVRLGRLTASARPCCPLREAALSHVPAGTVVLR